MGIGSLLDDKHWWTSLTASSKGYFVTDTEATQKICYIATVPEALSIVPFTSLQLLTVNNTVVLLFLRYYSSAKFIYYERSLK